jgi:ABC-type enterochelin transport system ATPase subunit
VVKIEALTKSFGDHTLFKDLTIEFPQGSLTVIMGAPAAENPLCSRASIFWSSSTAEDLDRRFERRWQDGRSR